MAAVVTSAVVVPTAYKILVKVLAHSFYNEECPPKEEDGLKEQEKVPLTAAQQKKQDQV